MENLYFLRSSKTPSTGSKEALFAKRGFEPGPKSREKNLVRGICEVRVTGELPPETY